MLSGARVQIPLSPLALSMKKRNLRFGLLFFTVIVENVEFRNNSQRNLKKLLTNIGSSANMKIHRVECDGDFEKKLKKCLTNQNGHDRVMDVAASAKNFKKKFEKN